MKKYLIGLFALAAIVLFSAFTAQPTATDNTTEYYFYEVISGQVNTSNPLNPGDPMTLAEFEQAELADCPEGNDADCIRAWEVGHTPSQFGQGDQTIRKDL